MKNHFEVLMHRELIDILDYGFSPADGITAIENVFGDLPKVHRPRRLWPWRRTSQLWAYTGRLEWYPLGFTYVQIGTKLHVIDIWEDETLGTDHRREVDAVVGREQGSVDEVDINDREPGPVASPRRCDTHERRVATAEYALKAFMQVAGDDPLNAPIDLLTNLMHWCKCEWQDFEEILESARKHFAAETTEILF